MSFLHCRTVQINYDHGTRTLPLPAQNCLEKVFKELILLQKLSVEKYPKNWIFFKRFVYLDH